MFCLYYSKINRLLKLSLMLLLVATQSACGSHGHNGGDHHGTDSDHHGEGDETLGIPGDASEVDRTIKVSMNDSMRFEPDSINVKVGETIKFDLDNVGAVKHEMVIGQLSYLIEHSEMMKKFPNMEHEEPNMLLLESSSNGELIWKFTEAGQIDFACLQLGHYDAGMKGNVTVSN